MREMTTYEVLFTMDLNEETGEWLTRESQEPVYSRHDVEMEECMPMFYPVYNFQEMRQPVLFSVPSGWKAFETILDRDPNVISWRYFPDLGNDDEEILNGDYRN